jgi:hypothetical protein
MSKKLNQPSLSAPLASGEKEEKKKGKNCITTTRPCHKILYCPIIEQDTAPF